MSNEIVLGNDINYLKEQPSENMNLILVGMTSLLNEDIEKIELLEKQNWYQRMIKTVTGKNKLTELELQENREKINLYISQALTELYEQNCFDHKIIVGLGNQINELYEEHINLKIMLGKFVSKLNEKIESIDSYHMLITEIEQGAYDNEPSALAISRILSQLDLRTINDDRKMEILERALQKSNIIENDEVKLIDFISEILEANDELAGIIGMFYMNIKNDYISEIITKVIKSYYFIPENIRKMKNKMSVIESVFDENQLDNNFKIATNVLYKNLIEAYSNCVVQSAIDKKNNELEENKELLKEYLENVEEVLQTYLGVYELQDIRSSRFYSHTYRSKFKKYISDFERFIKGNSIVGRNFMDTIQNIDFFYQRIYKLYQEYSPTDSSYDINANGILASTNEFFNDKFYKSLLESMEEINKTWIESLKEIETTVVEKIETEYTYINNGKELIEMSYSILELAMVTSIELYIDYYTQWNEILNKFIDEDKNNLDDIFDLVKKYPITVNSEDVYNEINLENLDDYDNEPYFEFRYSTSSGKRVAYYEIDLESVNSDYDVVVDIILNNMERCSSIRYEVLYNTIIDDEYETHEFCDISLMDWLDEKTIQLHISKNIYEDFSESDYV